MGYSNSVELIASFNGAKDVGGAEQFENLLVWAYAEHLAQEMTADPGD